MAEPTLYLFDGFNLLHAGGFGSPDELRDLLASWVAGKGARGVLVFDGHGADESHGPLEVRWAPDADTLIERLAAEHRRSEQVAVVSSDEAVRGTSGAEVRKLSSRAFLDELLPPSPTRTAAAATCATSSIPRRSRGSSGCAAASDPPNTCSYHVGSIATGLVKPGPLAIFALNFRVRLRQRRRRAVAGTAHENRGRLVSARTAPAYSPQKAQRELEDLQLVLKARNGDSVAMDQLMRRYTGFVRLKASSYFLAGGDSEDLIQEGLVGLYKAVRDFRTDKETSFRSFAELCVTRQIITAIKTATRFKHAPLNTYVSFSHTPAGQDSDGECSLGDALPGGPPCTSRR